MRAIILAFILGCASTALGVYLWLQQPAQAGARSVLLSKFASPRPLSSMQLPALWHYPALDYTAEELPFRDAVLTVTSSPVFGLLPEDFAKVCIDLDSGNHSLTLGLVPTEAAATRMDSFFLEQVTAAGHSPSFSLKSSMGPILLGFQINQETVQEYRAQQAAHDSSHAETNQFEFRFHPDQNMAALDIAMQFLGTHDIGSCIKDGKNSTHFASIFGAFWGSDGTDYIHQVIEETRSEAAPS